MYNNSTKPKRSKGVDFTMGPVYFNQFNHFAKHGVNALRIFQFIITKEGLERKNPKVQEAHKFIKLDNKKLYEWFGVGRSKKWKILKKLSDSKLIELRKNGPGKAPDVKIIVERHIN